MPFNEEISEEERVRFEEGGRCEGQYQEGQGEVLQRV